MKRELYTILLLFVLTGCFIVKEKESVTPGAAVQLDSIPGQCPYLTKDNKGNTVLSWVRMINDSTSEFCYARNITSHSVSKPIVIPNSQNIQPHGENLPKIIFKPSGEIIAFWGARNATPKNKYSGLIFFTQSFDDGKTWTAPKRLITDTSSFDQRYYDVALLSDGEVGVIWLDNRKTTTSEGSALYFMKTEGDKGFVGSGTLISESCCQCCRTKLLVDRRGSIHAIYRGILENSVRDMVHIVSIDGGKSFSSPNRISPDNWVIKGCPHTGPSMTENEEGIHFTWFTGGKERGSYYTKSTDNGNSFLVRDSVSSMGSHPQITCLPSGELLIAYEEDNQLENRFVKRIAVQIRNAAGGQESRAFITNLDHSASYPVLSASNNQEVVVAYTRDINDKPYVAYQKVSVR